MLYPWKTKSSENIFKSKWMRLRRDTCVLPSGREIDDYYVMEVPDGAAIIAITENNELVLVRQYKHGYGQLVLELPAGIVEDKEDSSEAVIRELQEETGYKASNVEFITSLITKPARLSGRTLIYFADKVVIDSQKVENDAEVIEVVLVPINNLPSLIQSGGIVTETTLAALMVVWSRLVFV